jgi:hypothetical protein
LTSRCGGDYSYTSGVTNAWFDIRDFYAQVAASTETSATEGANIDLSKVYLVGDSAGAITPVYKSMCGATSYNFNGNGTTLGTPPPLFGATASFYMTNQPSFQSTIRGIGIWSGVLESIAPLTAPPTTAMQGAYTCNMNGGSRAFSEVKIQGTLDTSVPPAGSCTAPNTPASCLLSAVQDVAYMTSGGGSGLTCSLTSTNTVGVITTKLYETGCGSGTGLRYDSIAGGAHDGALYHKGCTVSTATVTCSEIMPQVIYNYLAAH